MEVVRGGRWRWKKLKLIKKHKLLNTKQKKKPKSNNILDSFTKYLEGSEVMMTKSTTGREKDVG